MKLAGHVASSAPVWTLERCPPAPDKVCKSRCRPCGGRSGPELQILPIRNGLLRRGMALDLWHRLPWRAAALKSLPLSIRGTNLISDALVRITGRVPSLLRQCIARVTIPCLLAADNAWRRGLLNIDDRGRRRVIIEMLRCGHCQRASVAFGWRLRCGH